MLLLASVLALPFIALHIPSNSAVALGAPYGQGKLSHSPKMATGYSIWGEHECSQTNGMANLLHETPREVAET
eukprot:595539-Amphidinium_carterae.1